MNSLHLALLIIGVFLIVGIYLIDFLFKYKRIDKNKKYIPNDNYTDFFISNLKNKKDEDLSSVIENIGEISSKIEANDENISAQKIIASHPLKVEPQDFENINLNDDVNHTKDIVSDENELISSRENSFTSKENFPEENLEEDIYSNDEVVALSITISDDKSLSGLSISKSAEDACMVYGDMGIFHYFDSEKSYNDKPLFSMANMFEPGSFDLQKIYDFETKGVVVFMYISPSIELDDVFELFIKTTKKIAELMGGEIRLANKNLLNDAEISLLHEQVRALYKNIKVKNQQK